MAIVHEGDYESMRGLYCDNCHCADCKRARIDEAWDEARDEHNRRFPVLGPLTALQHMNREQARRMAEMFATVYVDPMVKSGTAFLIDYSEMKHG